MQSYQADEAFQLVNIESIRIQQYLEKINIELMGSH